MLGDVIDKKSDAPVLLDVRNGYEWDVGHFRGAERPVQESFRETVETNVEEGSGPLAGVDKSRPIMMYCTGGIRCDVYSTVLKEQGYDEVYTLEGGVQAYFDEFGEREDQRWDDQLFVFDSRLAMTPRGTPAAEGWRGGGDAAMPLLRATPRAPAASQLPQRRLQPTLPRVPGVPEHTRRVLLRRVQQGVARATETAAARTVPALRALHRGRGDAPRGEARRGKARATQATPRA